MKILSYSTYFIPYISGITIYQLRIWNRLAKKNDITVLTFPVKTTSVNISKDQRINTIHMPYLIKISKGFISPQSILYFIKHCRKNDVVVLNLPNFEAFPLAIIAKLMNKKIISIFQCEVFLGKDILSKIITFFLNISMNIQLNLSDAICVLPGYLERPSMKKKLTKKIITLIPPIEELVVDEKTFSQYQKDKGNKIWVGFFGRIAREKGIQFLIGALEQLKNKNTQIELIMVGPSGSEVIGEESYYHKILSLLDKKKINHRLFGLVPEEKLGSLIKNLDLLVLPSINKTEAFGMVQAEVMLLGVPVVASDMPGVSYVVKTTGMGELFKIKDTDDLSAKISKVLSDKKKYIKTKEEVKKIFNPDESARTFYEILSAKDLTPFFEKS